MIGDISVNFYGYSCSDLASFPKIDFVSVSWSSLVTIVIFLLVVGVYAIFKSKLWNKAIFSKPLFEFNVSEEELRFYSENYSTKRIIFGWRIIDGMLDHFIIYDEVKRLYRLDVDGWIWP